MSKKLMKISFDNFSDGTLDHVEINSFNLWKSENFPLRILFSNYICRKIDDLHTADHIEIITINEYERDLINNNLKSLYNYKYLLI